MSQMRLPDSIPYHRNALSRVEKKRE